MWRKHLTDRGAPGRQPGLEPGDLGVAAVDLGSGEPAVDPGDDDVLVVGPAEDADLPRLGQRPPDAPQEVVAGLLLGRPLERGDPASERVDEADHVLDRAVLPRGVDALEDEQHRPGLLGPEPLLEGGQTFPVGGQRTRRLLLGLDAGVAAGLVAGRAGRRRPDRARSSSRRLMGANVAHARSPGTAGVAAPHARRSPADAGRGAEGAQRYSQPLMPTPALAGVRHRNAGVHRLGLALGEGDGADQDHQGHAGDGEAGAVVAAG